LVFSHSVPEDKKRRQLEKSATQSMNSPPFCGRVLYGEGETMAAREAATRDILD